MKLPKSLEQLYIPHANSNHQTRVSILIDSVDNSSSVHEYLQDALRVRGPEGSAPRLAGHGPRPIGVQVGEEGSDVDVGDRSLQVILGDNTVLVSVKHLVPLLERQLVVHERRHHRDNRRLHCRGVGGGGGGVLCRPPRA